MRPVRPERSEYPKIQKAFRAAKLMKWLAMILLGVSIILSIIVGHYAVWYLGLGVLLILWSVILIGGYSQARCPHCGQVWWSPMIMLMFLGPLWLVVGLLLASEDVDETETYVCRRCRLDIGIGLK